MKNRLTEQELKVLSVVNVNAESSYEEISKLCGLKSYQARSALLSLIKKEAVTPVAGINLAHVGIKEYSIYIRLTKRSTTFHLTFAKFISTLDQVSWVIETVGAFDFKLIVSVRCENEIFSILEKIGTRFPQSIAAKNIVQVYRWVCYGYRFNGKGHSPIAYEYAPSRNPLILDYHSINLLDNIIQHPTATLQQRSRSLSVSPSNVAYRILQLKKLGVYVNNFYSFEPYYAGLAIVDLNITCMGVTDAFRKKLIHFCGEQSLVVGLEEFLGTHDFQIQCYVQHMIEVTELISRLEQDFGDCFAAIEIYPRLRTIKRGVLNAKKLLSNT